MKKLLLMVLASALTAYAEAKTIHWLTFIDTTDKQVDNLGRVRGVGEMDKVSRKVLYARFINVVNSALAEKGYKSDVQDYYDTRTSPENCKAAVSNLKCEPEDIVVFYYIGHGGRPANENDQAHPFPQMFLAQNYDNKLVPLEWVHEQLKSKGARLTITIGMCCNVKDPNMTIKRSLAFGPSVNYASAEVPDAGVEAIQKLFLESKGDLIASSSSPAESSYGGIPYGELGYIDDYTACFVETFSAKAEEGSLQWKSFFDELGQTVSSLNQKLRENGYRSGSQTPIFKPNIVSASAPAEQKREEPKEKVEEPADSQEEEDNGNTLCEYFDYVIDRNLELDKRIKVAEVLKSIFTTGAKIKVLGQDVDLVIDKESVDDYFSRISTADKLLKVVPVSASNDGAKLTEMKVREYYRK